MIIVPWQSLTEEALFNLVENVILREGTDYGEQEQSLNEKKQALLNKIYHGSAVIIWSELYQSADIRDKKEFFK